MRRHSILTRARSLAPAILPAGLLVLALALAPATLAADPPGSDPAGIGAAGGPGAYDPGADRAVPYIAALLVTSAGLSVVGLVAMRAQRRPVVSGRRAAGDTWWSCASCSSRNTDDRRTCFACREPRAEPPPTALPAPAEGPRPVDRARPAQPPPTPPPVGDAYSA